MQMVEMFVPMAAFIMVAVMTALFTRLIATGMLNRTIREAMKNDPQAVPALVERLDRHPPWGDALLGWVFIALAVAMLLFGLTEPDDYQRQEIFRATILPVVVGVAVLIYAYFAARNAPKA
jgi:ABC-type transport system involved in cytochrome c biogenesis permease subunit